MDTKYVSPKPFNQRFGIDISLSEDDIIRQLDACTSRQASKIIDYLQKRKPIAFRMYSKTIRWAQAMHIKGIRNMLKKKTLREKIYASGVAIPDDIREYLDTTTDDDYSEDYWP